ncbi:hypothetical protein BB559_001050 [Furculomyces boomerangus]|uniref:SGNH hydrolase-type esterase domain-containing protein n=2 Tax=Harpellales TaxID=61421 RepID=A0A2T9Z3C5_9FUNG|nr:hypothetical protein BB559_001050 [Furculomyces boomerangus]PVZ98292.1 hypothetical protein BB558_005693 [Smittium angustum]PWA02446.1 hypothetical protein BB558_001424 [Smittium angustum]
MSLKSVERIVVFGDSNVDGGNIFLLSGKSFPSPPYWKGRFTNGHTWVESMAQVLGISIDNYAYGGATIDNSLVAGKIRLGDGSKKTIPGVKQQILKYLKLYPQSGNKIPAEKTLFIIHVGSSDLSSLIIPEFYKVKDKLSPEAFSTRLSECIMTLHEHAHAKNIVVLNQFPHESLPYIIQMQSTKVTQTSRRITREFNSYLRKLINRISIEYPKLNIIQHDTNKLLRNVISDPGIYGLDEDIIVPAVDTNVKNNNGGVVVVGMGTSNKLWFDDSHMGVRMHMILAADIIKTISLHILANPSNFG